MWSRSAARAQLEHDFFDILVPYVLRAGIVGFLGWATRKLCGGDVRTAILTGHNPEQCQPIVPPPERLKNSDYATKTWEELRQTLGFHRRMALTVCAVRLLFWHWLQVVLYIMIFWAFSEIMDVPQFLLGLGVLIRECIYLLLTFAALRRCPGFLLFSPARSNWFQVWFYVFMPEKWLAILFAHRREFDVMTCYGKSFFRGALDLPAILALIVGICNGTLVAVPAIGYAVTGIGSLGSLVLVVGYHLGQERAGWAFSATL